jgi:pimeloyl-[acyl-carrier protein] methyl ester esterase
MPITAQSEDVMLAKASHAPFISHQQEFLQVFMPWLTLQTR